MLPTPATPAVASDGTVVVRVDATNARIELDGQLVAQSASGARVRVGAGEHALTVTAPGRRLYAGRVNVASGATVELALRLRHDAESAAPVVSAPQLSQAQPSRLSQAPPSGPSQVQPAEPNQPPPALAQPQPSQDKRNDPDYLVDPFSSAK